MFQLWFSLIRLTLFCFDKRQDLKSESFNINSLTFVSYRFSASSPVVFNLLTDVYDLLFFVLFVFFNIPAQV